MIEVIPSRLHEVDCTGTLQVGTWDFLVLDDPWNSVNDVQQKDAVDWYNNTLRSRKLND